MLKSTLVTSKSWKGKSQEKSEKRARSAMVSVTSISKDKGSTITARKRLLHTLVVSIASCSLECWVLKNVDKKKIEAFGVWCYRHPPMRIN